MLLILSILLALLVNDTFEQIEVFWTFSNYLEAVAVIPQIWFVIKAQKIREFLLGYYTLLFIYKALYICHWIDLYEFNGYYDLIAACSAVVQLFLYIYFFVVVFSLNVRPEDQDQQIVH